MSLRRTAYVAPKPPKGPRRRQFCLFRKKIDFAGRKQGRIQGGFVGFGRTPPLRDRDALKKFNGVRFGDIDD